jgi:hypothetical protein
MSRSSARVAARVEKTRTASSLANDQPATSPAAPTAKPVPAQQAPAARPTQPAATTSSSSSWASPHREPFDTVWPILASKLPAGLLDEPTVDALKTIASKYAVWARVLTEPQPIRAPPCVDVYRPHPANRPAPRSLKGPRREFAQEYAQKLLANNLASVNPTATAWHPVHVVPKSDGKLRHTIDLRFINAYTVPVDGAFFSWADALESLHGASLLLQTDLTEAFTQVSLAVESRDSQSFLTPLGVFRPHRVLMGATNSMAHLRSTLAYVANAAQLLDSILFYADELLGATKGRNPRDPGVIQAHLKLVERVLAMASNFNIVLRPDKTFLFTTNTVFAGVQISDGRWRRFSTATPSLANTPFPGNLAQLQSMLATFNYFNKHIPAFELRAAALRDLLTRTAQAHGVSATSPRKKLESISIRADKIDPALLEDWTSLCRYAADPQFLYLPDLSKDIILWFDASTTGFGWLVGQIPRNERDLPFEDMRIQALDLKSGVFKNHQRRWDVPTKELSSLMDALHSCALLSEHDRPVLAFTDHKNFQQLLDKDIAELLPKHNGMCSRWVTELLSRNINIQWTPGVSNGIADTLSRILDANAPPQSEANYLNRDLESSESQPTLLNTPPTAPPVQAAPPSTPTAPATPDDAASDELDTNNAASAQRPGDNAPLEPRASNSVNAPKLVPTPLFNGDFKPPLAASIIGASKLKLSSPPKGFTAASDNTLRDAQGRLWLPPGLQAQVIDLSHDADTNHLSAQVMFDTLSARFAPWPGMRVAIRQRVNHCATCQANLANVPRAVGASTPDAIQRLDMLFADYLYIDKSPNGDYILTMRDAASGHTALYGPFRSCTGDQVADALFHYAAMHGAPRFFRVDNATHNVNASVQDTCDRLGTQLKPNTVPYNPESLGIAERANREILDSFRIFILDELRPSDQWPAVLNRVMLSINQRPRTSLSGLSASDVFHRWHTPSRIERALAVPAFTPSSLQPTSQPAVPGSDAWFDTANQRSSQRVAQRTRLNAQPHRQDSSSISLGDFVFITRRTVNGKLDRPSKTAPARLGPATVIAVLSAGHSFQVRLLFPPDSTMLVPSTRVAFFKSSSSALSHQDRATALHTATTAFSTANIFDIQQDSAASFKILIGDPADDPSDRVWVPAASMVPVWHSRFLSRCNLSTVQAQALFSSFRDYILPLITADDLQF